ncbi:MAG: hypothetical protein F6K41_18390 [Symploca sp. SIO3E6]|nr:hypothetical protein [Caldora sp. SIO3E6]
MKILLSASPRLRVSASPRLFQVRRQEEKKCGKLSTQPTALTLPRHYTQSP